MSSIRESAKKYGASSRQWQQIALYAKLKYNATLVFQGELIKNWHVSALAEPALLRAGMHQQRAGDSYVMN